MVPGLHATSTTRRARRNYTSLIQFRPDLRIVGGVYSAPGEFHPGSSIGRDVALYSSACRPPSPALIVTKQAINSNAIGNMVCIGSFIEGTKQNGAVMWTLTQHVSPHPLYHTNTLSHPYGCCETQSTHHYCPHSSTEPRPDCSCPGKGSCCHEPLVLYTPPPEQQPTQCKKVTVDYVPNNVWNSPNSYNGDVDGNVRMCAVLTQNTRMDSCQGDSGGPILA